MPQHVINLLDGLLKNGGDKDINILGEGIKATLEIVSDMSAELTGVSEDVTSHLKDKDLHSPKGLLVRTKVIAWMIGIVILISTIVSHAPEIIGKVVGAIP